MKSLLFWVVVFLGFYLNTTEWKIMAKHYDEAKDYYLIRCSLAIVPTPYRTRNPGIPESPLRSPKTAILAPQEKMAPKSQLNGPQTPEKCI